MNDSNVVDNIVASGAAERAGMLLGDRVVGVNGVPLTSGKGIADLLPKGGYWSKVQLQVQRSQPVTDAQMQGQEGASACDRQSRRVWPPSTVCAPVTAGSLTSSGSLAKTKRARSAAYDCMGNAYAMKHDKNT